MSSPVYRCKSYRGTIEQAVRLGFDPLAVELFGRRWQSSPADAVEAAAISCIRSAGYAVEDAPADLAPDIVRVFFAGPISGYAFCELHRDRLEDAGMLYRREFTGVLEFDFYGLSDDLYNARGWLAGCPGVLSVDVFGGVL